MVVRLVCMFCISSCSISDPDMPSFLWPDPYHNITLAKKVVVRCPVKPLDWENIATTLNVAFSREDKPVDLKGRGCRERKDRLIEKYRAEDIRPLKRFV